MSQKYLKFTKEYEELKIKIKRNDVNFLTEGRISCSIIYVLNAICRRLRALYGGLSADVYKSVWVWYEDGLMTFYISN